MLPVMAMVVWVVFQMAVTKDTAIVALVLLSLALLWMCVVPPQQPASVTKVVMLGEGLAVFLQARIKDSDFVDLVHTHLALK